MDLRFSGKNVLITGGTGSVGMALIKVFAESGATVYFQYNSQAERAYQLEDAFGVTGIKMNFSISCQLPSAAYDILINNAGINISKRLTKNVTPEEWEQTLQVNVTTPYLLVQQCLPHMVSHKWGRIINICSIYGLRGTTKNLPYNVSKHGLSGLTKTIAKEYGGQGITCNEICPGPIESELMDRIAKQKYVESGITKEEYYSSIVASIPAGRLARPHDIAHLALFLASDYSAYINGASIPIDGGLIA